MTHEFDRDYWERHWQQGRRTDPGSMAVSPAHPHLEQETGSLAPGTALDAGCGAGAEAIWLAAHGWQVTGADISAHAMSIAAGRAETAGVAGRVTWVEADLGSWAPDAAYDLVVSSYAHPSIPQLDFYARISGWVAPGGTLLVVGHLHEAAGHGHGHPAEASVSVTDVVSRLPADEWDVVTADEVTRTVHGKSLRDVVVRALRR